MFAFKKFKKKLVYKYAFQIIAAIIKLKFILIPRLKWEKKNFTETDGFWSSNLTEITGQK